MAPDYVGVLVDLAVERIEQQHADHAGFGAAVVQGPSGRHVFAAVGDDRNQQGREGLARAPVAVEARQMGAGLAEKGGEPSNSQSTQALKSLALTANCGATSTALALASAIWSATLLPVAHVALDVAMAVAEPDGVAPRS